VSVFPDWQQFAVHQRREKTGCIPTGYEMILRSAGAQGVDFRSFQDDFDLEKDLADNAPRVNHFGSVAKAVSARSPAIVFAFKSFPKTDGAENSLLLKPNLRKTAGVSIDQQRGLRGEWVAHHARGRC
jgi:hypothetical protein